MKKFKPEDLDLSHMVTGLYTYPRKQMRIEAIQITPENVGALAIEFEAEMLYSQENGAYFYASVWREKENSRNGYDYTQMVFRAGFWIVPLRGELHLYDDYSFESTFWTADEEVLRDYAKKDLEAAAKMYEVSFPDKDEDWGTEYKDENNRVIVHPIAQRGTITRVTHTPQLQYYVEIDEDGYGADWYATEELEFLAPTDPRFEKLEQPDPYANVPPNVVRRAMQAVHNVSLPKGNQIEHSIEMEPVDVPKGKLFKNQDRVFVDENEQDKGTVVTPIKDDGLVEVLMDNTGQTYDFHPNRLTAIYPEIRTEQTKD